MKRTPIGLCVTDTITLIGGFIMARPRKIQPDYCLRTPSGRAFVRVGGRQVWLGKHGSQESKDKDLATVAE